MEFQGPPQQIYLLLSKDFYIDTFHKLLNLAPFWIFLILFTYFMGVWFKYKRTEWNAAQGSSLLEIKVPKEMLKSPAAMEIVLGALAQPGVGTYIDVYLKGRVRSWFSLEMVSIDGEVHFFILTQTKFKNIVELKPPNNEKTNQN